ncbi:MAG: isochorismatase family protein [Deltaproteobacteria bacterium]|nr:isochorismatase family protein [Deltaproteobacteria bacterium]
MIAKIVLHFFVVAILVSAALAQEGPNRPEPKPVTLDSKTTAVLVLDLHARCHDPKEICSKLTPVVGKFLEKVRPADVSIIYTVSLNAKETARGEISEPLKRRQTEPIVYPDHNDKFWGGELHSLLQQKGIKTLVVIGSSTNGAVLYTSTTAARVYRYNIVIPLDGVIARTRYEQEYPIHQFTVLPSGASKQFRFTNLSMISFH